MTVPGIIVDTSSNNGDPSKWDGAAMKAAGVRAIIAKATEGTTYKNLYFAAARSLARAHGMDFAAYHFAHFTDAVAEANFFRSVAGPDAKVLDSETNRNAAWQNAFLIALNLPGWAELDYGSASTLPRTGIRSLLWPAGYGQGPPGFGDLWQDTDRQTINGCPVQLDGSIWTGSQADYDAFFGINAPAPGPPIPPGVQTPIIGGRVQTVISIPLDKSGNGGVILNGGVPSPDSGASGVSPALASNTVLSCGKQGTNPKVEGYRPGDVGWQDHGGHPLVTYTGGTPGTMAGAIIVTA